MNLELLDTFLDLIETRNFNRTAERLGVRQSTVSSRIRTLEQMLGKQLFQRSKSGTSPTAAGARFQELASSLKLHWLDARRNVQSIEAFDQLIRIGLASQMYERVLESFLNRVRSTMPKLALYVEIDYADQMILDLTRGNLDLAVLYSPRHMPDLHYEQIAEERYVMVSSNRLHLSEVDRSDYIRANYSLPFAHMHKQLLPQLESTPLSVGNLGAIVFLLSRRGGTAYVTEAASEPLLAEGLVRAVAEAPIISHPIYSAVHVRHRHSHVHRRLLQTLKLVMDKG
ncbi:LysR family transcriptional regulator [Pseudaminobacter sp. 19-2017]|uniref:LysR family transcriptional regulator n=1 Tax=Pseudaminobacter soli (ex Zhang et al. 2022) TaxID=2831468 RepID=A0A942I8M2_9HYPH|nr:LysR family transcriptional regulator [Pseudaminobacter soli]